MAVVAMDLELDTFCIFVQEKESQNLELLNHRSDHKNG